MHLMTVNEIVSSEPKSARGLFRIRPAAWNEENQSGFTAARLIDFSGEFTAYLPGVFDIYDMLPIDSVAACDLVAVDLGEPAYFLKSWKKTDLPSDIVRTMPIGSLSNKTRRLISPFFEIVDQLTLPQSRDVVGEILLDDLIRNRFFSRDINSINPLEYTTTLASLISVISSTLRVSKEEHDISVLCAFLSEIGRSIVNDDDDIPRSYEALSSTELKMLSTIERALEKFHDAWNSGADYLETILLIQNQSIVLENSTLSNVSEIIMAARNLMNIQKKYNQAFSNVKQDITRAEFDGTIFLRPAPVRFN